MVRTLGPTWINDFDIAVARCRKPLFFSGQNAFYSSRNTKVESISDMYQPEGTMKKMFLAGNATLLTDYF
jgi:hypothetical protein